MQVIQYLKSVIWQGSRQPTAYTHAHPPIPPSSHYYCLLLGETGGGKSTLINVLCNYFRGGHLDRLKVLIPTRHLQPTEADAHHSEHDVHDQKQSQTGLCKMYVFRDECSTGTAAGRSEGEVSPPTFHFIDTPGLADTRGVDQDDDNVDLILQAACRTAYLHAIVLIINGSQGRETSLIRYILTKLKGNVPDAVLPTVMLILTKTTAATNNFDISTVKDLTGGDATVFYMNNACFLQPPGTADEELTQHWATSMRTIDRLIYAISSRGHANTSAFKLMVETRGAIKAELASVLSEIRHLGALRQRLNAAERMRREADEGKDEYKDFVVEQTIEERVQVDVTHLNTLCMLHKQVCHNGCGLDEIGQPGAREFVRCSAFQGGDGCQACPADEKGTCSYSQHYHERKEWKTETKKVSTELEEMKAKYFHCINQAEQASEELTEHQKDLALLRDVLTSKTTSLKQLCTQLKAICKNANLASELYAVTATMEYDAHSLQDVDARKEAEERIDDIKMLATELRGINAAAAKQKPHPNPHSIAPLSRTSSKAGAAGNKRAGHTLQQSIQPHPKKAKAEMEDLTGDSEEPSG